MSGIKTEILGVQQIQSLKTSLSAIPNSAERAIKSALHRVGEGMKTDVVRETKRRYHLLPGEIRRHLFFVRRSLPQGARRTCWFRSNGTVG